MTSSIYANLPEVLLKDVLDFAPQEEDMYRLTYDCKTERFVNRINPHYGLLNKVNQFKIDNPPKWDVDDPNLEEDFGDYPHDILLRFTIKFPLKLKKREGLRDRFCVDEDRYLVLDFVHSMSFEGFITKKCSIVLPEYYHYLISRTRFQKLKVKNYSKNHSKDLVFE
jgi:hypothetical protein